jgi:hypothetical protein
MTRCSKLSPPRPRHSHRLDDSSRGLAGDPACTRTLELTDLLGRKAHCGAPVEVLSPVERAQVEVSESAAL